jgi:hypothetical protein
MTGETRVVTHQVRRLEVAADLPFERFRERYEKAVPPEDHDDQVWLAVDQPSTRFASFGNPEIAAVGTELDGKLADLLTTLDIAVPAELAR